MIAEPAWPERFWSRQPGTLDLAAGMTLVLLLLYSSSYWYVKIPVTLLGVGGLLFPSLRRLPQLWFLAAVIVLLGALSGWSVVDNHKYLTGYWCLALYFSFQTRNSEEALATNARLLVGGGFACAVLWKLITPDFLDGSTFHYLLLIDNRLVRIATLLGQISGADVLHNRMAVSALTDPASRLTEVVLRDSDGLRMLATALTWGGLVLEGFVALAFLAPGRTRISRYRDLTLLLFLVSTYLLAPVIGFGWLLCIMGFSQARGRRGTLRLLYLATFVLLRLYEAPWTDVLTR